MEIRKKEEGNVYDDDGALVTSGSILAQKIQQLLIFFKLIIPDMTPEEVQYVDDALLKTYGNFGITHKNKSLLDPNDKKKYRKMLSFRTYIPSWKRWAHQQIVCAVC